MIEELYRYEIQCQMAIVYLRLRQLEREDKVREDARSQWWRDRMIG